MIKFKLKQLLKKKSILLPFHIVCSLFISNNAFSWGYDCCYVNPKFEIRQIEFYFKFFRYNLESAQDNFFLEELIASYSTDYGKTYKDLFSLSTKNQNTNTWAWVALTEKDENEKINFYVKLYNAVDSAVIPWDKLRTPGVSIPRLNVQNHTERTNETWLKLNWMLKRKQPKVTDIRIWGKWHRGRRSIQYASLKYELPTKRAKLNSNILNFSNSSPTEEIKIEANDNTVKAYKKANAIVVEGALNENIQVYTTTGKFVNSLVVDRDILQIPVPANQLYIVNVGQARYKFAL